MSMFNNNDANVLTDSDKSLETTDVCADGDSYQSQLSVALRGEEYPPCEFKKRLSVSLPRPPENNIKIQKLTTPPFPLPVGCLKKPLPLYISQPISKHLLDS